WCLGWDTRRFLGDVPRPTPVEKGYIPSLQPFHKSARTRFCSAQDSQPGTLISAVSRRVTPELMAWWITLIISGSGIYRSPWTALAEAMDSSSAMSSDVNFTDRAPVFWLKFSILVVPGMGHTHTTSSVVILRVRSNITSFSKINNK
ncbi:hypothetical protein H5410_049111, partial [Solanum commersonii]